MPTQNRVLLTDQQIEAWKSEDVRLTGEIAQKQERQALVRRKLQAAEEFIQAELELGDPESASPPGNAPQSEEPSESPAVLLVENMRTTGASLNAAQVRDRLIELGFGNRLKEKRNFHYSLLHRLHSSGKLLKRASKYRAPPISSPEGETEAVGASVRH